MYFESTYSVESKILPRPWILCYGRRVQGERAKDIRVLRKTVQFGQPPRILPMKALVAVCRQCPTTLSTELRTIWPLHHTTPVLMGVILSAQLPEFSVTLRTCMDEGKNLPSKTVEYACSRTELLPRPTHLSVYSVRILCK